MNSARSSGHVASAVRAAHYEGVAHSLETASQLCLIGIDAGTFHQFPLIADIWERDVGSWLNLKYAPAPLTPAVTAMINTVVALVFILLPSQVNHKEPNQVALLYSGAHKQGRGILFFFWGGAFWGA